MDETLRRRRFLRWTGLVEYEEKAEQPMDDLKQCLAAAAEGARKAVQG